MLLSMSGVACVRSHLRDRLSNAPLVAIDRVQGLPNVEESFSEHSVVFLPCVNSGITEAKSQ